MLLERYPSIRGLTIEGKSQPLVVIFCNKKNIGSEAAMI